MSRLQDLINELCPDGVVYKKLGDCVQKTSNIKWKTTEGSYFYIDLTSVDRDTHKITEIQTVNETNAPSRAQQIVHKGDVLFATTRPTLKRFCLINDKYDGQVCSTGFCVLRAKENLVIPQWLFHIVSSSEFYYYVEAKQKGASYPAISDKEVKQFEIPVPPLSVQREIVRILDNFTELTAELKEKLTKEITARKKQYEYYRDSLFSFELRDMGRFVGTQLGNLIQKLCPDGMEYTTFGEVVNYEQPSKYIVKSTDYNDSFSTPVLTAGQTFILGYTNEQDGIYNASKESPVIIFDDFTGAFKWVDFPFKVKSSAIKMLTADETKTTLRYIYHFMGNVGFTSNEHKRLWIGTYSTFELPLPPLSVQREIVRILDRFDTLCNDLTSGLPAEIAARQKQYEYYRDKLLQFKIKNA